MQRMNVNKDQVIWYTDANYGQVREQYIYLSNSLKIHEENSKEMNI